MRDGFRSLSAVTEFLKLESFIKDDPEEFDYNTRVDILCSNASNLPGVYVLRNK